MEAAQLNAVSATPTPTTVSTNATPDEAAPSAKATAATALTVADAAHIEVTTENDSTPIVNEPSTKRTSGSTHTENPGVTSVNGMQGTQTGGLNYSTIESNA